MPVAKKKGAVSWRKAFLFALVSLVILPLMAFAILFVPAPGWIIPAGPTAAILSSSIRMSPVRRFPTAPIVTSRAPRSRIRPIAAALGSCASTCLRVGASAPIGRAK